MLRFKVTALILNRQSIRKLVCFRLSSYTNNAKACTDNNNTTQPQANLSSFFRSHKTVRNPLNFRCSNQISVIPSLFSSTQFRQYSSDNYVGSDSVFIKDQVNNSAFTPESCNLNDDNAVLPPSENVIEVDQVESFASYGLGGWDFPHHWIQSIMEYLHTNLDISWMPTIAILTVTLRLIAFPAYLKMRAFTVRTNNNMPEQMKLQMTTLSSNPIERKRNQLKYMEFLKEKSINPFQALIFQLPTAAIFISFFAALRGMAEAKIPSLVNGGMLWFSDLTIADPYFLLPVIACTSMHLLIRFGAATAELGPTASAPFMKNILLWSPFVLIPFMIYQPTCMFLFWITSNAFSFMLSALFLRPDVQRAFGIPKMIQHSEAVKREMNTFMSPSGMSRKMKQEISDREHALKKVQQHMNEINKFAKKDKK